jgi:hypothetical protein
MPFPLYHRTTEDIARKIVAEEFRDGGCAETSRGFNLAG